MIALLSVSVCALLSGASDVSLSILRAQTEVAEDPAQAELRAALEEARAAQAAGEHEYAREVIAAAVETAIPWIESSGSAASVELGAALGKLAYDCGELRAADRVLSAVLAVRERTLGADHPESQAARANVALVRRRQGDFESARPLEEQVLEVRERTLPADHFDLQAARMNLAGTLFALGERTRARDLAEQALEVFERTLAPDHPAIQVARYTLGGMLQSLGELEAARVVLEKALEVSERTLPADHLELQAVRGNLAIVLRELGDLARARALELQVLEVRERKLPADNPDLAQARTNLAATLAAMGEFSAARVLLEQVLEVGERTLRADHPELLNARANLAATMFRLGDLAAARVLGEEVLEIRERTLPADHPMLQGARTNLAVTLKELDDLAGARRLLEQVVEVLERTLDADHVDLQAARMNLAATLSRSGERSRARELEERVVETFERTLPADHPELQRARWNLSVTLKALGEGARAQELQEMVLEVRRRTHPVGHSELQSALGTLATAIALQAVDRSGERSEEGALALREQCRARCVELVGEMGLAQDLETLSVLRSASMREAEERCSGMSWPLGMLLSFASGYGVFEPLEELWAPAFALCERTRGAGLATARVARAAQGSPEQSRLAAALRGASRELAELSRRGATREEYHAAREARERAERELGQLARERGVTGGWEQEDLAQLLGSRLRAGEALVGLRRYPRWWLELESSSPGDGARGAKTRSAQSIGAFVLARPVEGEPPRLTFVDLGPRTAIEGAVRAWRSALGAGPSDPAATGVADAELRGVGLGSSPSGSEVASGRKLRELVWDPLLDALGGARTVILASDDVLHLVPFDALPSDEEGVLLGDNWRIELRIALWELLDPPRVEASGGAMLALGGAAYDEAPQGPEAHEGAPPRALASLAMGTKTLRSSASSSSFAPLVHTGPEALAIAQLFSAKNGEGSGLVLEGRKASRETLEALAPRARFLHVATHGWFAPESLRSWTDVEPEPSEGRLWQHAGGEEVVRGSSPMVLCGLALAGANLPPDSLGRSSGLVTAEELSTLDLAGCELAVLSACDTNAGELRAGQGVASMQKALHMAGARSVITSLWKVPDEATRALMLDFYRRLWSENEPIHRALWEAKQRLRKATDAAGRPLYTTRDWAAWVLTGG